MACQPWPGSGVFATEPLESQLVATDSALHPEPVAEKEPKEPQSCFEKMERSTMLKGEATAEERVQAQVCVDDLEGDR